MAIGKEGRCSFGSWWGCMMMLLGAIPLLRGCEVAPSTAPSADSICNDALQPLQWLVFEQP